MGHFVIQGNKATDNGVHVFKISDAGSVAAVGATSGKNVDVSLGAAGNPQATGNQQTVLRTKLTLSSVILGATSGRTRMATDNLATLTFSIDPAYDATVNEVTLTFAGAAYLLLLVFIILIAVSAQHTSICDLPRSPLLPAPPKQ